jgi:hypothetical protein
LNLYVSLAYTTKRLSFDTGEYQTRYSGTLCP